MNKPISYKQYDARWKNISYSNPDESTTIGRAGCGTTSTAMVIASLKDANITPIETSQWALEYGYKYTGGGTHYNYFVPQFAKYGITCKRLNTVNNYGNKNTSVSENALEELKKGNWIIACVGKGIWTTGGHYILVYGYEDGNVYVNDPGHSSASCAKNTFKNLAEQAKYFWSIAFTNPIKLEEKKDVTNPYPNSDRIIRYTSSLRPKEDAKWLQFELNKYGYNLKIDGCFGIKSVSALRDFQKKHNLKVDGKCGVNTRKVL